LNIINDILDYSKQKMKDIQLSKQSANLRELIGNIFTLLQIQAMVRGIKLVQEIDPNIPKEIITDPNRL
jgi:signal transduction histidine kinase